MSSETSESYPLFKITKKRTASCNNEMCNVTQFFQVNSDENELITEKSNESGTILSILWKNNKLGAAFYKFGTCQLYVMNEIIDLKPQFRVIKMLINDINPVHIVTIGSTSDRFIKKIIAIISNSDDDISLSSDQTRSLPQNITLLPFKDYSFEICLNKVLNINLLTEPPNLKEKDKEMFLRSLIDLESNICVHALGILIKFLEKNWASYCQDDVRSLKFLNINQTSLTDTVFIDRNTFTALEIFKLKTHDARFKHGGVQSNKEGIGLLKLFSQYCKSKVSQIYMRYLMMNPTNNINELNKRLDFIEFAIDPRNQGIVENLSEEIKHIVDLSKILVKVLYLQAKTNCWNILHKTLSHIFCINEICRPIRSKFPILEELNSYVTADIYGLQQTISTTIEFSVPNKNQRPTIKFGLDTELDAKKLRQKDIAKTVTAAANFAVNQLPEFLNECSVVFVPEMGHLISIKEWEPGCDRNALENFGYQFVFEIKGNLQYKNSLCKELDRRLGSIPQEILSHETRIIQRLSEYVLQYSRNICESIRIISFIDCLLAMSMVAQERAYVRPKLNEKNIHEVENGRHPIYEIHFSNFVPNNFATELEKDKSKIKILTGPNSSGKSVYLKQVAVLIYLAHIGSFLPADKANIGLIDSIYSRISSTETASIPLSAFMIDLVQVSQALNNAKKTSLVLIDEFGRGTTGSDGKALLAGALNKFNQLDDDCPLVIVSTHYQTLINCLPNSQLIKSFKMDHALDGNKMILLYKVVEGVSSSFAFDVAAAAGLPDDIVSQAREIFNCIRNNEPLKPLEILIPPRYREIDSQNAFALRQFLEDVSIPDLDVDDDQNNES